MCSLSAEAPISVATAPMKNTYIMYLNVVASALKVQRAFAKNEKVTATQKAMKLDTDWLWSFLTHIANTTQCISVFRTPIVMYRANNLDMVTPEKKDTGFCHRAR